MGKHAMAVKFDPEHLATLGWNESSGDRMHLIYHKKGGGWYMTQDLCGYTTNVFMILAIVFGTIIAAFLVFYLVARCRRSEGDPKDNSRSKSPRVSDQTVSAPMAHPPVEPR